MFIYYWFACRISGGDRVDSVEEAQKKFYDFDKKIYGAYRFEVRNADTHELIYKSN